MALSVLVTGGAGFIGGHFVKQLVVRLGAHVVAIDNFDPFYDPGMKREHWQEVVADIPHHRRPELAEMDVRDAERLKRLFAERDFDIVVHMAARAGVRPSIADPAGYMDVNVTGTACLYEACRAAGIKKAVFASSSSVYGDKSSVPFSEFDGSAQLDSQISPYAVSKRAGELLTRTFSRLNGWRTIIFRLFTVYGPWQRPDLAIHKFTRLMMEGSPIPVFGDGSMMRDHTHVKDVVSGMMSAVQWVVSSDTCEVEVANLGSDRPIKLSELIAELELACGVKAKVERRPVPPGDVPVTCADLTHARELLGYEPRVPLREGLAEFVEWYRQRR